MKIKLIATILFLMQAIFSTASANWLYDNDKSSSQYTTSGVSSSTYSEPCEENCGTTETRTASVPEPSTFALMGIGVVGLMLARRRQKK